MATRHAIAVAATDTTDLTELAGMLIAAVKEVEEAENAKPAYRDTAVRLIAFHIAFAGMGDVPFYPYYIDAFNYCMAQAQQDLQELPIKDKPHEPVYKAS